jgi:hypothetical protein
VKRGERCTRTAAAALLAALGLIVVGGCTRESVRIALAAQGRADQVQQAVFDQQHQALTILLYRDLAHGLAAGGTGLDAAQHSALNEAWNERDKLEFWAVQHERAKALRLVGVEAALAGQQAVLDLQIQAVEQRAGRIEARTAQAAAEDQ